MSKSKNRKFPNRISPPTLRLQHHCPFHPLPYSTHPPLSHGITTRRPTGLYELPCDESSYSTPSARLTAVHELSCNQRVVGLALDCRLPSHRHVYHKSLTLNQDWLYHCLWWYSESKILVLLGRAGQRMTLSLQTGYLLSPPAKKEAKHIVKEHTKQEEGTYTKPDAHTPVGDLFSSTHSRTIPII